MMMPSQAQQHHLKDNNYNLKALALFLGSQPHLQDKDPALMTMSSPPGL
jgi:hypothetical protein